MVESSFGAEPINTLPLPVAPAPAKCPIQTLSVPMLLVANVLDPTPTFLSPESIDVREDLPKAYVVFSNASTS